MHTPLFTEHKIGLQYQLYWSILRIRIVRLAELPKLYFVPQEDVMAPYIDCHKVTHFVATQSSNTDKNLSFIYVFFERPYHENGKMYTSNIDMTAPYSGLVQALR